jgi:four helix bundle protein
MASIQRFEDLICWQKSRELTHGVYQVFRNCSDYGFRDQIQRAAVSVMSNVAEGFERGTQQEFVNYLYIAKGSAGEVRAQLYAALDAGYLNIGIFKHLNSLAMECSRLIQSFADKVKSSGWRGIQFRHVQRPDDSIELLRQHAPEIYEKYYKHLDKS